MNMLKAVGVAIVALIVGTIIGMAITMLIGFNAFGAYMPDGFSVTGLVYGMDDTEFMVALAAGVVAAGAAMVGVLWVGEDKILA